jgi:hypothetical protein
VRLFGVTITGNLECDNGQFINPGDQALSLEGARTGAVYLRNCFTAEGEVWLFGATIAGNLECDNGQFINPRRQAPHDQALNLEDARTGAILLRNGFRAEGGVRLSGATIAGNLECDNGEFINPPGQALNLEGARTGAVLLRNGFRAEGEVYLRNATIGGDLDCNNGHFINSKPVGLAINAELANVQGSVRLDDFEADGSVSFQEARIDHEFILYGATWHENDACLNLTAAKVKTLLNRRPKLKNQLSLLKNHLFLHGLTFDELGADADQTAEGQIEWINLQPSNRFWSQPYEQMAKVFREMGLQEEAVKVMIRKNYDHGVHPLRFKEVLWYGIFGPRIDFGYRPLNALYLSLLVILLGYFLFKSGAHSGILIPTKSDAYDTKEKLSELYPKFNAFVYSLETFVPLVKLGISEFWAPNANRGTELHLLHKLTLLPVRLALQLVCGKRLTALRIHEPTPLRVGSLLRCYLWIHIIAGWILTTLWVGGFTGLLKT